MDDPEWITVSRRFLAFLESDGEGSTTDLAGELEHLLAAGADVGLPDTDEEAPERDALVTYKRWYACAQRRFPTLADSDCEPGGRWAGDDLADIATDLEEAVDLWEEGLRRAALWEFRFGWQTHWGPHHARPLLDWLRRTT